MQQVCNKLVFLFRSSPTERVIGTARVIHSRRTQSGPPLREKQKGLKGPRSKSTPSR